METKNDKYLKPNFELIPDKLNSNDQWVCWRAEKQEGREKPTKVPYNPRNGRKARVNEPATWTSFEEACQAYKKGGYDGIGFVLTENDPYTGFDFDDCIHNDFIYPIQMAWVERLNSYTEISPSGEGLRTIVRGTLPAALKKGKWEVYSNGRYLTFTGHKLPNSPARINESQKAIDDYLKKLQTIIEVDGKLRNAFESESGNKIIRLLQGQWEDFYPSQSEADGGLVFYLTKFIGRNHTTIDQIFRESKLYRPQWDVPHYSNGDTYGERIIKNAISEVLDKKSENQIPIPVGITAAELTKKEIPPIKWIIEGLLAEGLSILGGKGLIHFCRSPVAGHLLPFR